ncbi:MAG TPA: hypothetical protein VEU33_38935 [Archangium sp.]|nr:hypothetical protein [Archangium sp.]
MKRMLRSLFVTGFAGLTLAACGTPLATPQYPGEPLVTLRGTVSSERTEPLPSTNVELVWLVPRPGADLIVAESVPVEGQFPSHFKLSLHTPPDEGSLAQTPYGPLGMAYIGVFDETTQRFVGAAEEYVLAYLPAPVEAGSVFSQFLDKGGGARALSAGYHLIHAEPPTEAEYRAYQDCLAHAATPAERKACFDQYDLYDTLTVADDDLTTSLQVRIPNDPSKLRLPNFT